MNQNIHQKEENGSVSVSIHYLLFLRDKHEGKLSLKDADKELCRLVDGLRGKSKGRIPPEKRYFIKYVAIFLNNS